MDAFSQRIADEFNHFVAIGQVEMARRPMSEHYIVATRCEIDIDGFASVYEQDLDADELKILIDGLNHIGEHSLANEFQRGYELLEAESFYSHQDWHLVSPSVKDEINVIGRIIGDQLWDLDEKLVILLDGKESLHSP